MLFYGFLQNVTRGHNVASAILVRDSCCLCIERLESRSRVLIGVLQDKRDDSKRIYLCNVHLEAGEKNDDNLQRYHQLKSLFKRLTRQVRSDNILLDDASIIMAGDFNMLRKSPLHTFLSQVSSFVCGSLYIVFLFCLLLCVMFVYHCEFLHLTLFSYPPFINCQGFITKPRTNKKFATSKHNQTF